MNKKKQNKEIKKEEQYEIEPYCEILELKKRTKDFDDDLLEY